VTDPKQRHIHKASVRDRVIHHAIYSKLYNIFNPKFIATSFSCRKGKGSHKGVNWLYKSTRKVSKNYTKPCFVLKCDIRKFFDSVDHNVLLEIIRRTIKDEDVISLVRTIVDSFYSKQSNLFDHKGVPIGNLTSQIFANIYMNEFDQYVKRSMKTSYYARYSDDFVIVSSSKQDLEYLLMQVRSFLLSRLSLSLHPSKVSIRKLSGGIDFLGYVIFPHHTLLRTKTKNRIYKNLTNKISESKNGKIGKEDLRNTLYSYLGTLSHADTYRLSQDWINKCWFK
jgi:retron-type reverse transcriptase